MTRQSDTFGTFTKLYSVTVIKT